MKPNELLLPLLALAGFACSSNGSQTETTRDGAADTATEAAVTRLPEVRYYVIADT